jgi:hypothetical protein
VDSGSVLPLLLTSETGALQEEVHATPPVGILFGGGSVVHSTTATSFGDTEGQIVPTLIENLFGPQSFIDAGATLFLDHSGGSLSSTTTGAVLPIHRTKKGGFAIWVDDLKLYPSPKLYTANAIYQSSFSRCLRDTLAKREVLYQAQLAARAKHRQFYRSVWGEDPPSSLSSNFTSSEGETSEGDGKASTAEPLPPGYVIGPDNLFYIDGLLPSTACRAVEPNSYCLPVAKVRHLTGDSALAYYNRLHERLGHPRLKTMLKAISGDNPTWKNCLLTEGQIRRFYKKAACVHCLLHTRNRRPIPKNDSDPYDFDTELGDHRSGQALPGEILSIDPAGPINPQTRGGHKYFWLIKDVCTGYIWAITSSSKSAVSCIDALDYVIKWLRVRGHKTRKIRSDFETTFDSTALKDYCDSPDISCVIQKSVPYKHYQNAVERDIQTVVKGASLLLGQQPWLRKDCWDLALFNFVQCRNRCPNAHSFTPAGRDRSPYQWLTGRQLDLSRQFQFSFGDFVAVATPDELRDWKFDMRNQIGIYVGDDPNTKDGCCIFWPYSNSISTRGGSDCTKLEISDAQFLHYFSKQISSKVNHLPYTVFEQALSDFKECIDFRTPLHEDGVENLTDEDWTDIRQPLQASLMDDLLSKSTIRPPLSKKPSRSVTFSDAQPSSRMSTRGVPQHAPSSAYLADPTFAELFHSFYHPAMSAKITVGKALSGENAAQWIEALAKEINLLLSGGTLVPIDRADIPAGPHKIIHSTLQLKVKLLQSGLIDKFKARLCACGNELWSATAETYSPTIGALAYATVHQIAVIDRMSMCTVDTVGAYLYQDYPDDATPLYLTISPNVSLALGLDPNKLYRIKKYLYGLPDSGRAYYKAYAAHLKKHGYERTTADPCLFVKINGQSRTYVFTHVDDTFVCSTDPKELLVFQDALREIYSITVNDNVSEYLGIKMTNQPNGDIKLTQPKLLQTIFDEHLSEIDLMQDTLSPQRLAHLQSSDTTPMDQTDYLHLLGALIYITKSRPDIATAVSFASVHASRPTLGAYAELLLVVKYLHRTRTAGLTLKAGEANRPLHLKCYVDASYLTHNDSKSHTGFCLSFGEIGSFYSKSSKQTLVATSSTHAEMRALYSLCIEIVFVIHLCQELGRPVQLPAIVLEDNQPVIDLSADLSSRAKKCKHFLMLVRYVREQVDNGLIAISKVPTAVNVVDILTKIVVGNEYRAKALSLLGETSFDVTPDDTVI